MARNSSRDTGERKVINVDFSERLILADGQLSVHPEQQKLREANLSADSDSQRKAKLVARAANMLVISRRVEGVADPAMVASFGRVIARLQDRMEEQQWQFAQELAEHRLANGTGEIPPDV